MIPDIRVRINAIPFLPFIVRTTDGREYPVPTIDHIYITPGGRRVVISDDEDLTVLLTGLHISALVGVEPVEKHHAEG